MEGGCRRRPLSLPLLSVVFLPLFLAMIRVPEPAGPLGATLTGRVVDDITGKAVGGAFIEIPEAKMGTRTAKDGTYTISNVPPRAEPYEVLIRKRGYRPLSAEASFGGKKRYLKVFRISPRGY